MSAVRVAPQYEQALSCKAVPAPRQDVRRRHTLGTRSDLRAEISRDFVARKLASSRSPCHSTPLADVSIYIRI
jgi:hypothetical protein